MWRDFFATFVHVTILRLAQLGAILRKRNKSVEIVAVAEPYLIITHVNN